MVSLGVEKCGRVDDTSVSRKRIMRACQPFTARNRIIEGPNVNYIKNKFDQPIPDANDHVVRV